MNPLLFCKNFFLRSVRHLSLILLTFQVGYGQDLSVKADVTVLEQGKLIKREIAGGQKHVYKITLTERQYADISVEQIGVDLVARLVDAGSKLTIRFDGDIRTRGTEKIQYAVSTAGDYTLEVEAKMKNAPAASYTIVLNETGAATEDNFLFRESLLLLAEAERLSREGKFKDALPLTERALTIREKNFGSESRETAIVLNRLGTLHLSLGDNAKSETYLKKALGIYEKLSGANDLDAADTLTNLAIFYRTEGEFAESEKLFLRALEIREKELGSEHHLIALSLNGLGILYRRRGDNAKAQEMYERSLGIRERLSGADSLEVASTLFNLAALNYYKGDYAAALKLYERVLAVSEKKLPPEHPHIGDTLNNLGMVNANLGDSEKAETFYLRAITNHEKNFGLKDETLIPPMINLAELYAEQGDFEKAEKLFERVLKFAEKNPDNEDLQLAEYLIKLGDFYILTVNYKKAESFLNRALTIREKKLGKEHFEVRRACSSLARLYLLKGEAARAIPFQECANRIGEKNIALNLFIGTEHQKLSYMALLAEDLNQTINLQIALPENKAALEQAVTTLLQRKGRVLEATAGGLTDLRRRFDREDQLLLQKLNDTIAALAQVTLNKPANATLEDYQKQIAALEDRKANLESEISRRSGGFFEQSKPLTLA